LKFRFDLKNRLDLSIAISGIILVITGAFLRFFKYFFPPVELTEITYILVPEFIIFILLITIKIWKGI